MSGKKRPVYLREHEWNTIVIALRASADQTVNSITVSVAVGRAELRRFATTIEAGKPKEKSPKEKSDAS